MEAARPARSHATTALAREAGTIGLPLSQRQLTQFEAYLDTLLLWRQRVSLTTAASPLALVRHHVLDALSVVRLLRRGSRLADLGSGTGFPGVPIAVARPDCRIVLVESKRKKANFLREVVRRTRLANVEVMEERAESVAEHSPRTFDVVVCRAVWGVPEFLRVSRTLLRRHGLAVAMKGPRGGKEAVVQAADFHPPETVTYRLHGGVQRLLLVYRRR